MSDFGEYLPFDAKLHTGNPAEFHNAFPFAWADANRKACDEHKAKDVCVCAKGGGGKVERDGKTPKGWPVCGQGYTNTV